MESRFQWARAGEIDLGCIDEGRGAPVMFVHGSGATDARTWGPQIETFVECYRVIACSLRYHYPNAWLGDGSDLHSTKVHANDLANLIAGLQLGRVHLIGNSYGAEIVLRLAVDHPELVRTLVIEEPALLSWVDALPGGSELLSRASATMASAKRAVQDGDLELGVRRFIDAALGEGVFDQLPASTRDRLMDNARLIGLELMDLDAGEMIGEDITRDEAAAIEAPALILTGDESPEQYRLVSRELASYMPHAEQAQITGAAHVLHSMNPRDFNATVLAFLAKHAS